MGNISLGSAAWAYKCLRACKWYLQYTVQVTYNILYRLPAAHCTGYLQYTVQVTYNTLYRLPTTHCTGYLQHTANIRALPTHCMHCTYYYIAFHRL